MAIIRHMRRSAVSVGRSGSLIREISWKAGKAELICLHGGLRFRYIGLILCLGRRREFLLNGIIF